MSGRRVSVAVGVLACALACALACSKAEAPEAGAPPQAATAAEVARERERASKAAAALYPGAAHVPDSQGGWERFQTTADPDAPLDEAMGGKTRAGTPISKRDYRCFPAEARNLFHEVDQVVPTPGATPAPFDYRNADGVIDQAGRDAIRGQNTWMLWGEGNEVFWNWLQQDGYGLVDFLVLLDSRTRATRFARTGLVNQPGLKANTVRNPLGLYLDAADASVVMKQPATDIDAATHALAVRPVPHDPKHPNRLFEPGDQALYDSVVEGLPDDGIDPAIYGYASGIVGLRLMPNPDFFGNTDAAARARAYWMERVKNDPQDRYYTSNAVQADPRLVRPFRINMSCGFCHVGPHPLRPPASMEAPEWANLSGTIGNQYWSPPRVFANLTRPDSFLHHFLASQQPGTIDTSLVSTDHINNANTINAIFDVPARLARAGFHAAAGDSNAPEKQSPANLLLPSIEDATPGTNPRKTPRVLLDGADSIGAFGALARVFLNIGTFPEEWARCHNPIIGFKPQRPFGVATLQKKSAYWQAGEKYRVGYLAAFFTHKDPRTGQSVTSPMKLRDAPGGAATIDDAKAGKGRAVFLRNCALCHSSKQPSGFELAFSEDWRTAPVPAASQPARFTLPARFEDWEEFRGSAAFEEYGRRIDVLANAPGTDFLRDNFLSNEVRIPVTLVGTNSGRAVATNGMRGQVWDNFSSETYKELPAVPPIRFYNPYRGGGVDRWGNNDAYQPPGQGPGYYRPASLVSLWATAPYLHNNALGLYNQDPSVAGRLAAFEDGIDKLLDQGRRDPRRTDPEGAKTLPGDLRVARAALAVRDPGFIYRTPQETTIGFAAPFIRPLLTGILGPTLTSALRLWLWVLLVLVALALAYHQRPRLAGIVLFLIALVSAALIVLTRIDRISLTAAAAWLLPLATGAGALWFWVGASRKRDSAERASQREKRARLAARVFFLASAVLAAVVGWQARAFVDGRKGGVTIGPIPEGTPVNLLMNMNPEAPLAELVEGVSGLARGMLRVHSACLRGPEALQVFEEEAGPALLRASKCPDFVLDRGHWFGEGLTPDEKDQLKAFLKTL
jgi:hypothetical protein